MVESWPREVIPGSCPICRPGRGRDGPRLGAGRSGASLPSPVVTDPARAVENLVYAYAERIDAGDLVGVAELFRHGRIQTSGAVFEGAEEVRRMYEGAVRLHDDGTPRTRHVTTNVAVDVDEPAPGRPRRGPCTRCSSRPTPSPSSPSSSGATTTPSTGGRRVVLRHPGDVRRPHRRPQPAPPVRPVGRGSRVGDGPSVTSAQVDGCSADFLVGHGFAGCEEGGGRVVWNTCSPPPRPPVTPQRATPSRRRSPASPPSMPTASKPPRWPST